MPTLHGSTTPRLFTPPLRPLEPRSPATERRTAGYLFIDFAEEVCGVQLLPYQKWLAVHALELREDGSPRFRTIIVLIARQNGKSTFSQLLALFAMYVLGVSLVLGAAQDLEVAEEIWQGACEIVEETPDLLIERQDVVLNNGKKALVLTGRRRYKVKAANRRAARGLSGDLVMLDELREQQNWQAWSAISKTMMARPNAQLWGFSNAGDVTSVVLAYLRKVAHRALGNPDGLLLDSLGPTQLDLDDAREAGEDLDGINLDDLEIDENDLGLFEWSAPPGCSIWDREGWAWANPALGYGLITERAIRSAARTDPEWVFRIEVLCQWPDGSLSGPFPTGTWEQTTNKPVPGPNGAEVLSDADKIISAGIVAGIHVSQDRSRAYIAVGGWRADGLPQIEIAATRAGSSWMREWLQSRSGKVLGVAGQGRGTQGAALLEEWAEDRNFTIPVHPIVGGDLLAAHGIAFDYIRDGKLRHNPQPVLDQAATSAATRKLGEGWVIDATASEADTAPLQAFIACLWLLTRPRPAPKESAYEEHGLEVV